MSEWDALIIGGGPAGLTAGLYLARANRRTLLVDKDDFGGYPRNVEWVENYPGFPEGVSGSQLSLAMVTQAKKYGLRFEQAEVNSIEQFGKFRWVGCKDGNGYTANVVIIAGGSKPKKLNVPGEQELQGKGIIHCALCDGSEFANKTVAVCGGGDAGITEALYLTRMNCRVFVFEALPHLSATAILQERALANPKLEIKCGIRIKSILGKNNVEAIECQEISSGNISTIQVEGILIHVGLDPDTGYLNGTVPLDKQGQIIVNSRMESEIPFILAAGDIRSGSPRQITAAVGDGAITGITAQRLLQENQ